MGLFEQAVKGIKWNIIGTIGSMLIQFVISIILARILLPEEFGIAGVAYVVVMLSRSFVDSGLYQALIQKKDATRDDFSVVFKFNLLLALLIFIIIQISSYKIGNYFNYSDLQPILNVLSFVILIESFSLIQRASLIKSIRFDKITKINIFSRILSGIVSIYMALNGFGVWSLVYKEIINSFVATLCYWIFNPVRINLYAPKKNIINLLGFGLKVFFADQIENWSNQLATVLIGKKYTASDIGYYSKATELQSPILNIAIGSINSVMYPTFSKIQDNDVKLKEGYKWLLKLSAMIMFPLMFVGIVVSDEFIPILLGNNWRESIPYFKLLCISSMIYPFTLFNLNIIKVKGKANLYLNVNLITKGLILPAVIVGIQFHIIGLVIGLVIQRFISAIINSYFSGRVINYSIREQIIDIYKVLLIAIISFIFTFYIKKIHSFSNLEPLLVVIISLLVFTAFFIFLLIIFKDREYKQLYLIFLQTLHKKP